MPRLSPAGGIDSLAALIDQLFDRPVNQSALNHWQSVTT
jgi:hypothetical protein